MRRAHQPPPADRDRRRHRRRMTALAAGVVVGLLVASCSAEEPNAEPSPRDTVTATSGDGATPIQATVDGTSDRDGTGDTDDGSDDAPTATSAVTTRPDRSRCGTAAPTEIRFDVGASSTVVDAAASSDQRSLFTLEVNADQIMTVAVGSAGDTARATLLTPTADLPSAPFTQQTIAPTLAGTYEICVIAGSTGADYELFVSVIDDNTPVLVDEPWCGERVNDRGDISFDPGAFGTTVEGGIVRGERDLHTIGAGSGQEIDLALTSLEDNAVLDLRSPSGETLVVGIDEFRLVLPEEGDYQICIGSLRGNTSYTLEVTIT